jgi:hypothetical protein
MECLNEPGGFRRITQGETDFVHGLVEITIKINECICRPEFLPNLFPGYKFARTVQQQQQNLEGLILKMDSNSVLP